MSSRYKKKSGLRDPRQIIIAVEGAKREKQYFEWFAQQSTQVKVAVLAPQNVFDNQGNQVDDVGKVKPREILERLIRYAEDPENYIEAHDCIWVVADADKFNAHHEVEEFRKDFVSERRLISENRAIALSMHCFELWLLLHKQDLPKGKIFKDCPELKEYLGSIGGFDSTQEIPIASVEQAIERAKELDKDSHPIIPNTPGTKVYLLAEQLLAAIRKS